MAADPVSHLIALRSTRAFTPTYALLCGAVEPNGRLGKLKEALRKIGGEKIYLLIDFSDFTLDPTMADEYGKVAKDVVGRLVMGIVRYGHPAGTTTAAVRVQAIKNRFPSNVFADREAALVALEQVRKLPEIRIA